MKTKNLIAVLVFAIAMVCTWEFRQWRVAQLTRSQGGSELPDISDHRSRQQILNDRLEASRNEAQARLLRSVTNSVGYRRHTGMELLGTYDNPADWYASGTVETINKLGGVDAQHRKYLYTTNGNWVLDPKLTFTVR